MKAQRNVLYDSAQRFFDSEGSGLMKLSADAAIRVCLTATSRGLIVARVEGGIWHHPGFEARVDCIWDGADPPIDPTAAEANNQAAADFIREECREHDVFVVTAPPLTGWPHGSSKAPL